MTCATASVVTLIDNLKRQLRSGLNTAYLGELLGDLEGLRAELSAEAWRKFCLGDFRGLMRQAVEDGREEGVLRTWERTLPSVVAREKAKSLLASEVNEFRSFYPRGRVLALGEIRAPSDEGFEHVSELLDRKRAATAAMRFDLIYTADWLSRSNDVCALEWMAAALRLLRGSGRFLGCNLTPGAPDAAYMAARFDDWPVFRDEQDLAHLAGRLSEKGVRGRAVFRDESGAVGFLEIESI